MYLGYQQIALTGAPVVKTAALLTIPGSASGAMLQANSSGDINYTMDDATQPGSSTGMVLKADASPEEFLIEDVARIRFVQSGADTALNVHFFGGRDI